MQNYKLYLTITFILLSNFLVAQSPYNKTILEIEWRERVSTLLNINDTLIYNASVRTYPDDETIFTGATMAVDTLGNEIHYSLNHDSLCLYLADTRSNIISYDNKYLVPFTCDSCFVPHIYDKKFNLLKRVKICEQKFNDVKFVTHALEDGFIFAGNSIITPGDDNSKIKIVYFKTNKNFEIIWDKEITAPDNYSTGIYQIVASDGDLLFSCVEGNYPDDGLSAVIIKIDTSGNILEKIATPIEKNIQGASTLFTLDNGDYLIEANLIYPIPTFPGFSENHKNIRRISDKGDILWSKSYGRLSNGNDIKGMIGTKDDNFVFTGLNNLTFEEMLEWQELGIAYTTPIQMTKINEHGEILWSTQDSIIHDTTQTPDVQVKGITELSSGNLILYGDVSYFKNDELRVSTFLIQYDKDGCKISDCRLPVSVQEELETKYKTTVYPNPAKNILSISSYYQDKIKQFQIIDNLGRRLQSKQNPLTSNIDVSDIPPGINFLKVIYDDDHSEMIKFLKF